MPLKIPPFTPVNIQPTSAEPFSTFVNSTPLATTPLTGTELVPIIQRGVSSHTTPNAIAPPFAHRTILTANTNYYVTVTGSDANDGSLAHPWATLQHAAMVIATTRDIAGFNVYVNIGAGSFVGFGFVGCVGSGILQFEGAGSGSTTITAGPNDGIFNFGECVTCNVLNDTIFGVNAVKVIPANGNIGYATYTQGIQFNIGDATFVNAMDAVVDFTGSTGGTTGILAQGIASAFFINGDITFIGAGANISAAISVTAGQLVHFGKGIVTGSLTVTATVSVDGGIYQASGAVPWTGAGVTGPRAESAVNGTIIGVVGSTIQPGQMGPNFFPGSLPVVVTGDSSYDGFRGATQASGLPTTTQFPDPGTGGLYKDTSGGGVYVAYNDAGTIKKVQLT